MTDLETVLLLAVGVLMWRLSAINGEIRALKAMVDRYADALVMIGDGKGRVKKRANGTYYFEGDKDETRKQAR